MLQLDQIKNIGKERKKILNKLGVETGDDLLYYFPRSYEDRSVFKKINDLTIGETVCVVAMVANELRNARIRGSLTMSKGHIVDETGRMSVTFFNQQYVSSKLKMGQQYVFYGKVGGTLLKKEFTSPDVNDYDSFLKDDKILSVYRLSAGLTQKLMRSIIKQALDAQREDIVDSMDKDVLQKRGYLSLAEALSSIHFPRDFSIQAKAKERLIFDELFYLVLGIRLLKNKKRGTSGCVMRSSVNMDRFYDSLPYALTDAQRRAIEECLGDFERKEPMNRLVQGDVGCGKTVVAAALIYYCVQNGYQTAFMAPTEVLANQHYDTLSEMLNGLGVRITLLTGSMGAAQKRQAHEHILHHETDVVIGTHALISQQVEFANLAFCVTDEQHRFGVRQRAALADKGEHLHVLVMSATPIPRTLGLILYGDLDISIIDTLPPGRKKVDTFLVDDAMSQRIHRFIKKQAAMGFGTYIVCPAVEDDERGQLTSVVSYAKELKEKHLLGLTVDMIHGKMKSEQKQEIMRKFMSGETQVLVATTVIEVGVNAPNATVMVVQDAQQFGLSQLHQLRGRVGRSQNQSYCILFCNSKNQTTIDRLKVMIKTNDGFLIAQKDLEFRGPGEFLGDRQHGLPALKIANLTTDMQALVDAKKTVDELLEHDPGLNDERNAKLRQKANDMFFGLDNQNIFN